MIKQLHFLAAPDTWGAITIENVTEFRDVRHLIFDCGKCSADGATVYHNIIGEHNHISANDLLPVYQMQQTDKWVM